MKKILGAQNWVWNYGFCHFLEVVSLVSLDIAQDCSLGQCLTSIRAKTSKKFGAQIGVKMIFSILMLSSIHSKVLVIYEIGIIVVILNFIS